MDGFRNRSIALFAVVMILSATTAGAARLSNDASSGARVGVGGGTFLVAPVLWVLGALGLPVQDPSPLPNSCTLDREQGLQSLVFPLHDDGLAVYLEVRGRVEFERAEVLLADGSCRSIALDGAARGRGLYELVDLGATTGVDAVQLSARARSSEAQVGVRLGR